MAQQSPLQRQAAASSVNALFTVAGAHGERLDSHEAALGKVAEAIRALETRLKALEATAPAVDGGDAQ